MKTDFPLQLALKFSLLMILIIQLGCQFQQADESFWPFMAPDRIQSDPVSDEEMIYFGSDDGIFYAIESKNAKMVWTYETHSAINSKAVIDDSMIYFSSGNNLYALNKNSGKEIWTYIGSDTVGSTSLDPWDYHNASPIIDQSAVYTGFGNGDLKGFDRMSGVEVFKYTSLEQAPIRSTPVIHKGVIYFGDWNGRLYSVDLLTGDSLWTYRTYEVQLYQTFGQLNAGMIIKDSLLLFGARNPEIQAVDIRTGTRVWSYVEETGGWISGSPVLSGDTMFIGGSDNHKLIAFDIQTGAIYWEYSFIFNNFSTPVLHGNHIFFTTGDAYAITRDNPGNGYLYVLDRSDGTIINMHHFEGNVFVTPLILNGWIITGNDMGQLCKMELNDFVNPSNQFRENGHGPVTNLVVSHDSLTGAVQFSYTMKYADSLWIRVRDFNGKFICQIFKDLQVAGDFTISWDGKNEQGEYASDGYFSFEVDEGIIVKNQYFKYTRKQ